MRAWLMGWIVAECFAMALAAHAELWGFLAFSAGLTIALAAALICDAIDDAARERRRP